MRGAAANLLAAITHAYLRHARVLDLAKQGSEAWFHAGQKLRRFWGGRRHDNCGNVERMRHAACVVRHVKIACGIRRVSHAASAPAFPANYRVNFSANSRAKYHN